MANPSETMSAPAPAPASRRGVDWIRVIVYSLPFFIVVWVLGSTGPIFGITDQAKRAEARAATTQFVTGLKAFRTEYDVLPTGTNAQILAALRGDNPRKVVFFECRLEKVNALGEFINPWKTPYRIDTTNPAFPWAYSFGKDKQDNGGAPGSDDIASWLN